MSTVTVFFTTPDASIILKDVTKEVLNHMIAELRDPNGVVRLGTSDNTKIAVIPSRHVRNLDVREVDGPS